MGRGQRSPAPTRRGSSAMGRSAGGADHEMELEELRKQIQGALESRSTAILQHYKEAMQRDVNEKVYEEITKVSKALKQLKEAELHRGKLLRQLRGELESLAADLRRQSTLKNFSQPDLRQAKGTTKMDEVSRLRSLPAAAPKRRGTRTLRD